MPAKSDIYIATESAMLDYDGVPTPIHAGHTRVRGGHVLLEQYPEFFEPIDVHYDVEQATAAPGEKRTTRRSTKPADKDS